MNYLIQKLHMKMLDLMYITTVKPQAKQVPIGLTSDLFRL